MEQEQLLRVLEQLLQIEALDLKTALSRMADLVGTMLAAEKVDVFLYEEATHSLVAIGTSDTPLSMKERALGLDRLPLVNGGYMVEVFQSGQTYFTEHADQDAQHITGMISEQGLGIRSEMGVALIIDGHKRGVLMASSRVPAFFNRQQLSLLVAVAHWVSLVIHHIELTERYTRATVEQSRRLAAEEILTTVAHDLRNGITPLKINLDLLQMRASHSKRYEDRHDLASALGTLHRLNRMVADLLDVARLNRHLFSIQPRPVAFIALVQTIVNEFQTATTPIELRAPHDEIMIVADAEALRRAIENVLINAIRHATEMTPVEIFVKEDVLVTKATDSGKCVVLSIYNQGPTIAPDVMAHLFEPFSKNAGSKGLGIGLYIAHGIVEAHDGTIEVDTSAQRGVRFILTFPATRVVQETTDEKGEEE